MEMKEYKTPAMEVIKMKYSQALLEASVTSSGETPGGEGTYTGGPIDD